MRDGPVVVSPVLLRGVGRVGAGDDHREATPDLEVVRVGEERVDEHLVDLVGIGHPAVDDLGAVQRVARPLDQRERPDVVEGLLVQLRADAGEQLCETGRVLHLRELRDVEQDRVLGVVEAPVRRGRRHERVLLLHRFEQPRVRTGGAACARGGGERDSAGEPDDEREAQPRLPPAAELRAEAVPHRSARASLTAHGSDLPLNRWRDQGVSPQATGVLAPGGISAGRGRLPRRDRRRAGRTVPGRSGAQGPPGRTASRRSRCAGSPRTPG